MVRFGTYNSIKFIKQSLYLYIKDDQKNNQKKEVLTCV